jgi:hypothetical protein
MRPGQRGFSARADPKTPRAQDIGREDVWVKSFLSRLAGLVRDIGNRDK